MQQDSNKTQYDQHIRYLNINPDQKEKAITGFIQKQSSCIFLAMATLRKTDGKAQIV